MPPSVGFVTVTAGGKRNRGAKEGNEAGLFPTQLRSLASFHAALCTRHSHRCGTVAVHGIRHHKVQDGTGKSHSRSSHRHGTVVVPGICQCDTEVRKLPRRVEPGRSVLKSGCSILRGGGSCGASSGVERGRLAMNVML